MIGVRPPGSSGPEELFSVRKGSGRLPVLTRHEIVQAKVIQPHTGRGAMIAIKGRNVIAGSDVPLEKDQLLLLRVEQAGPAPRLRLLGITGRSSGPSLLLQAAEQNCWRQVLETLGGSMAGEKQGALRALLEDLSFFFARDRGDRSLRDWIDKSGLAWENKLRSLVLEGRRGAEDVNRLAAGDLKGTLAGMTRREEGVPPMMERLLSVIEALQWFNCGSVTQSGKLLFLIPCRFPDGSWTVAELLIQKEPDETREDSGKAKTGRIVLTAQLEGLGWVRAELALENKDIRMAFLSESTPSKSRIESRLPFLIETLQGRGFRVGEAKCEVGDRDRLRHSFVDELSGFGSPGFNAFA